MMYSYSILFNKIFLDYNLDEKRDFLKEFAKEYHLQIKRTYTVNSGIISFNFIDEKDKIIAEDVKVSRRMMALQSHNMIEKIEKVVYKKIKK